MKRQVQHPLLLICCVFAALLLGGCNSDLDGTTTDDNDNSTSGQFPASDDFTVSLASTTIGITEGQGLVEIPVTLTRDVGHQGDISLTTASATQADDAYLTHRLSDDVLSVGESNTSLQLDLAIGPRPIKPQTRNVLVTATDIFGASSTTQLTLQVQPTSKPDIYLLIGQSNMVGISEDDAKLAGAGQADAPVDTIRQLNVTFNDADNFSSPSDFTDPAMLFNTGNPLTIALDPLHSGLQSDGGKTGTRIGMGLSFAKRALQDTTAEIFLIPAAWSDTGFCKRETNTLPGIGWNATTKAAVQLSGTLLHDRAIARTDIAIAQTDGILRGILWHQGEADSDDAVCAQMYAENLTEMIQSLRTNIAVDARGTAARGANADIPFIAGTMAMGGEQAPFSETKTQVDDAIRNLSNTVSFADFVNNDDLIPPAFPCGGGSCIHFGAEALREMGARYYERLISVLP